MRPLPRREDAVFVLLPRVEERLRGLRPALEELRREGAGTSAPKRRFELTSSALDELEQALELVRETRAELTRVEQRLTRSFDRLLRRLRELERSVAS